MAITNGTLEKKTYQNRTLITINRTQMDEFMSLISKLVATPPQPHVVGEHIYFVLPLSKGYVQDMLGGKLSIIGSLTGGF